MMDIKIKYIILTLILLFSISIVSAGILDWFDFTGKATSGTHNISVTLGNSAPTVLGVSSILAQSITESASTSITFYFWVQDIDGAANLNDSSSIGTFQKVGETSRTASCSKLGNVDATTVNYSCTIDIWYFDGAGVWIVNVTAKDLNDAGTVDVSTNFNLGSTTAMTFAPLSLTFSGVTSPADIDTLADQNVLINNTGNDEIVVGNVRVTGRDLIGETDSGKAIIAENFTVHTASACNVGTFMVNTIPVAISGATLPKGNYSINDGSTGQEQLFYCLEGMDAALTSQAYTTAGAGAWTVGIS